MPSGGEKMNNNVRQAFSSSSPHFFKIVLAGTLRERKIRIPKKFVRKYGESLSNPVILKLPSGLEWKVELTSCDGEVCLQKGWPEFMENLSIGCGYRLVFRYEANSHFHLIIFDTSAVEMDYPTKPTHFDKSYIDEDQLQEPKREEFENDDSVEILDGHPSLSFPKTREKSRFQCPQSHKRTRSSVTLSAPSCSGPKSVSTSERTRALERVGGFKSENPFFVIIMERSYVHGMHSMIIPKTFAESYLNKKGGDLLLILGGRSWSAQYKSRNTVNRLKVTKTIHEICYRGWKAFALDNSLKVGDVCIFVLINGRNDIFQVSIDRHADHLSLDQIAHRESQDPQRDQNEIEVPTGSKLRSWICKEKSSGGKVDTQSQRPPSSGAFEGCRENTSFQMLMGSSHVNNSNLGVPASFGRSHLGKMMRNQNVKLRVGKKWWDVKLIRHRNKKVYMLSGGWRAFARDNCLRIGDVCRFEMIESNKSVELQVFITHVK